MTHGLTTRQDRLIHALSDVDAEFVADIIYTESGVRLSHGRKTMIQARLIRRMQALGLPSLEDYVDYLRYSPDGLAERSALVDVLTTHKTEFFRERHHFDFLQQTALPALSKAHGLGFVRAWSAGCSSGEEAWTLAMVLADYYGDQDWRFRILASDISMMVLETASRAVYPQACVASIPPDYQARYLMRGRGRQSGNYRVIPELREKITFRRESLLDIDAGGDDSFEIIFCRNVMIYFDRDATIQLVKRLVRRLVSGGYLFIGHSETVNGNTVGLRSVAPTVFQKP